jgi:hypothetical protein
MDINRAGSQPSGIAPGEKHWHGAGLRNAMAHIAIVERLDGKTVEWLEYVTDEQYRAGEERLP